MKKSFVKILMFLLFQIFVNPQIQQNELDSLHVALRYAANDTIRMDTYYRLGVFYAEVNTDSSLKYLENALTIAQQLKLKLKEADILDWLGYVFFSNNNYPKSLEAFLLAIKIVENHKSEERYWRLPKAITPTEYRLQRLSSIYNSIGLLYGRTGNTEMQINSYNKARALAETSKDTSTFIYSNMNLGEVYLNLGKPDSALILLENAFNINSRIDGQYGGYILWLFGRTYQAKHEFASSRENFFKGIEFSQRKNTLTILGDCYISLSRLYKTFSKTDSSLYYARKSLSVYKKIGVPSKLADSYSLLAALFSELGNKDSTLVYLKLSTTLKDSLFAIEKKNLIAFQNLGFDEKIRLQELEKEKVIYESKIRTYGLIIGIVVLLLIAFLLFRNNRTRKTANLALKKQNEVIHLENQRKTKELEEARQLQLSMLPKKLPQLPNLDIAVYMKTATEVGGDYYDFNIDDNETLTVLVGDATGHGMMSGMMVSIIKSFFISNRSSIDLKQFFENTNNSLKEMQLGRLMMPLIGVQINSEKLIATNAGMPSLIYFRNKSQKAGEFVSNSLPLGGMKGTQYLLKEIRYEKGDTLLLMSDGFAELKNPQNEQYGYARIKEKFRSIVHKSSYEIIEELKHTASKWLNGAEPDDDVTFVVIKVM